VNCEEAARPQARFARPPGQRSETPVPLTAQSKETIRVARFLGKGIDGERVRKVHWDVVASPFRWSTPDLDLKPEQELLGVA